MDGRVRRAVLLAIGALLITRSAAAQQVWRLDEVLARARQQAPEIVSARLAIGEAEGRLAGASLRSQANPELDVNPGNRQSPGTRSTEFQVGIAQQFEPSGRRRARILGATAEVDQRRATVGVTTRDVLLDAAQLYYQGLFAGERVRLLGESADLAQSVATVAERRFAAGDLAILDVHLARAAVARASAEQAAARAEQADAIGALRTLLRMDGPLELAGDLAPAAAPDEGALEAALLTRPDLQVLEAGIREADADVTLARTYQRPVYTAGLRYQREGQDHIVLGGLTITLPIFNTGQELAATGTARRERLRAELDAARTRVRLDLRRALDVYAQRVAAARALAAEAVPGLEEVAALTARSFDVGQIGLPDVLTIRRELLETRMQALSAQLEVARARVTVDATAGVLR